MSRIRLLVAAIAFCTLVFGGEPVSAGLFTPDFEVNQTGDQPDAIIDGFCDINPLTFPPECTLRAAIMEANAAGALGSQIIFDIPGAGPHVITPPVGLPVITNSVFIDGYTQDGSAPNTNSTDQGLNTVLKIAIDGSDFASEFSHVLRVEADNVTIRGLALMGNPASEVTTFSFLGNDNAIEGSFIGTNVQGTAGIAPVGAVTVFTGEGNVIGGPDPADRNLISPAGGTGIRLTDAAQETLVQGNLVGTDVSGMIALPNLVGVMIANDAVDNIIGGSTPGERNIIAGSMTA
jgi:hypothetical protein